MKNCRTPEEDKELCDGCTMCCEYITVIIKTPKTKEEIDRVRWYLLHNVSVYISNKGEWKVYIPIKCTALNNKNQCSIYKTRPQLCREHAQDSCERHGTAPTGSLFFTSVKEFDKYLRNKA